MALLRSKTMRRLPPGRCATRIWRTAPALPGSGRAVGPRAAEGISRTTRSGPLSVKRLKVASRVRRSSTRVPAPCSEPGWPGSASTGSALTGSGSTGPGAGPDGAAPAGAALTAAPPAAPARAPRCRPCGTTATALPPTIPFVARSIRNLADIGNSFPIGNREIGGLPAWRSESPLQRLVQLVQHLLTHVGPRRSTQASRPAPAIARWHTRSGAGSRPRARAGHSASSRLPGPSSSARPRSRVRRDPATGRDPRAGPGSLSSW